MNVLFIAAEVDPWIKTGGLADVAGALPRALAAAGHDVRVVMPRYRVLRERGLATDGPMAGTFLPLAERAEELRVWRMRDVQPVTYLLDIPAAFERHAIYGETDDHHRFILFARGALDLVQYLREVAGWHPDVLHCNDWHSALVPNYVSTFYAYTFGHLATVLTIHNLAYQGVCAPETMNAAGLSSAGHVESGLGPRIAGTFNFMARGILYSNMVSTVSPTYAREITTSEYGEGLDGLLRARRDRLKGILNGIDAESFDPSNDGAIAARYSSVDPAGKVACKTALQLEFGLPDDPSVPLLGIVSRLVGQKGLDLIDAVIPWLLSHTNAQLVLLGSGEARWEERFQRHAAFNRGRIGVHIGFDGAMARRIYAGSDAFLMPSKFEPCGLGQMLALRYGSVPIVRATGGLNDTVREGLHGNGFRFHMYSGQDLAGAIARALQAYGTGESWAMLRARGMAEDNSWTHAAAQYEALYHRALQTVRR